MLCFNKDMYLRLLKRVSFNLEYLNFPNVGYYLIIVNILWASVTRHQSAYIKAKYTCANVTLKEENDF